MTLGTLPASELDAEALAEELWQINHSLVESLAPCRPPKPRRKAHV